MKKKKAFTLIELLVVIAIIAILLAILLPSLKKVKQIAKDVVCRSNLKHWGTIWQVYTNENQGLLPDPENPIFNGIRRDWIAALREDYPTGQGSISQCPNASKYVDMGSPNNGRGGIFSPYRNIMPDGEDEFNSYGMNLWSYSKNCIVFDSFGEKRWGRLEGGGASRDTIPLFMDSTFAGAAPHYDGYWDPMNMVNLDLPEPPPDNGFVSVYHGIRQFAIPRHGSGRNVGINVVFFDMSIRPVMAKEVWSLKWHRDFETNRWKTERGTIWNGEGNGGWWDKLSEDF